MRKLALAALVLITTALPLRAGSAPARKASLSGPYSWTTGTYAYDASGNVTAMGTYTFTYDPLNRIATSHMANDAVSNQAFAYDVFGNITNISNNDVPMPFSADPATNHLAGTAYDDAGNARSYTPPGSAHTYTFTYDALNMTSEEAVDNTTTTYFVYTADDERLRSESTTTHTTHWRVRNIDKKVVRDIQKSGAAWSVNRDYFYRGDVLLAAITPTTVEHFSLDHLGTPRVLSDTAGTRISTHTYLPFGQELGSPAADGEPMKFTGHERDDDPAGGTAALDYMHARYYTSSLGRFLSIDPKHNGHPNLSQSWNRYAYTHDNPLKAIDPNGEDVYIVITNVKVGNTRVNSRPHGGGTKETVPAYRIVVMNESGSVKLFSGSRDSNYAGAASQTRGQYGSDHEAPPGKFYGHIRKDGDLGSRVELSNRVGGDQINAPSGEVRENVQIHVGPGCSQGCVLLTGGKDTRNTFINTVENMQKEERDAGRSELIHVFVEDRQEGGDLKDDDSSKKDSSQ